MPVVEYEPRMNGNPCMGQNWFERYVKPLVIPSPKRALTSLFDPTAILPGTGLKAPTLTSFAKTALLDKLRRVRTAQALPDTTQPIALTLAQKTRLRNKLKEAAALKKLQLAPTKAPAGIQPLTTYPKIQREQDFLPQGPDAYDAWATERINFSSTITNPTRKEEYKTETLQLAKKALPGDFLTRMDQGVAAEFVGTFLPELGDQPDIQAAAAALTKNGAEMSARNMGFIMLSVLGVGAVLWGLQAAAAAAAKKKAAA